MPKDAGLHVGDKVKIKKKDAAEHEGVIVGVSGDYVTIHKTGSHLVMNVNDIDKAEYTKFKDDPGNSPELKPEPEPVKDKDKDKDKDKKKEKE